jgi:cystathionine beta-lyase/cystathionine gamma-synthase
MESPTSWVMEAHDVGALALARQHGVISMIDNSWASPVFQRPLTLGVDLVIHSASKYLGGHSDVVAGVVAGSKEMIARSRPKPIPISAASCRRSMPGC